MPKVSFYKGSPFFYASLKTAVNNYFISAAKKKTGNVRLYAKTLILICSAVILYLLQLFLPMSWLPRIVGGLLLGFVLACIGFNVMHDANHNSYSSRKWVNEVLGLTLNALGGNS